MIGLKCSLSNLTDLTVNVQTEALSTRFSPSGSALYEPLKYEPCSNGKSISKIISQSPSPQRPACSVERATRLSSGEKAGPSSRELSMPDQMEGSGSCSVCEKNAFVLSNVPGKIGLLCSMCR